LTSRETRRKRAHVTTGGVLALEALGARRRTIARDRRATNKGLPYYRAGPPRTGRTDEDRGRIAARSGGVVGGDEATGRRAGRRSEVVRLGEQTGEGHNGKTPAGEGRKGSRRAGRDHQGCESIPLSSRPVGKAHPEVAGKHPRNKGPAGDGGGATRVRISGGGWRHSSAETGNHAKAIRSIKRAGFRLSGSSRCATRVKRRFGADEACHPDRRQPPPPNTVPRRGRVGRPWFAGSPRPAATDAAPAMRGGRITGAGQRGRGVLAVHLLRCGHGARTGLRGGLPRRRCRGADGRLRWSPRSTGVINAAVSRSGAGARSGVEGDRTRKERGAGGSLR